MSAPASARRRLGLAVAALAALAVLGYAALPRLIASVTERALTAHGLTAVRIEPGYAGPKRLPIHTLELSGRGAGRSFTLIARDLEIGYSLAQLLDGRIARLRISEAALRLEPAPEEPAANAAAEPPLPGHWVEAFPLDELVIGRLQIESRQPDTPVRVLIVRGEAHRRADRIESRWTLAHEDHELFHAALALTASGELKITAFPPDAPDRPVLTAINTIAPAGAGRIGGHGTLDARLGPLDAMFALALPAALTPLEGRVQAHWNWETAAAPAGDFNGALTLDVSALRLGTSLRDGALHLDATVTGRGDTLQWRIGERLHLAARPDPARLALTGAGGRAPEPAPEPLVLGAPRGLAGEFARTPTGDRVTLAGGAELTLRQLHTPEAQVPALTLALPRGARLIRDAATGAWRSEGFDMALGAPAIDTRLPALGRLDHVALSARIASGPLVPLPSLTIRHAAVSLLGGRVQGRDIHYRSGRGTSSFVLELEQLDLARIVALERQQEIEASGRLDGTLPVTLAPGGARIADGRLRATPPGGVIRYRAGEGVRSMAESNPNLDLVLRALSNYHYDELEIEVSYAENGDLALAVAMGGRNPDWNAGHPVHLNINVEENVPMLLRSLRLAEDVGGAVEKRVRERPAAPR